MQCVSQTASMYIRNPIEFDAYLHIFLQQQQSRISMNLVILFKYVFTQV